MFGLKHAEMAIQIKIYFAEKSGRLNENIITRYIKSIAANAFDRSFELLKNPRKHAFKIIMTIGIR